MCKELAPLRCDTCQKWIEPGRFIFQEGRSAPHCPDCDEPLDVQSALFANPFPLALALAIPRGLAKILVRSGVLEHLQEKAKGTESPLDDLALRIAKAIIQEAANL